MQALADARSVLVIGMLTSESSANYLHHVAATGFHNWHLLVPKSAEYFQLLGALAPGDVVVCIAVEPCAAESIKVARYAREAGARVIGITDRRTSPLAASADDILLISVHSPNIFPSHIGATALVEVLVGMIAARDERSVAENVENAERSRRNMGEYWSECEMIRKFNWLVRFRSAASPATGRGRRPRAAPPAPGRPRPSAP